MPAPTLGGAPRSAGTIPVLAAAERSSRNAAALECSAPIRQAGAKHIFVEQDRTDGAPLEAIKISYDYLRKLRLSM